MDISDTCDKNFLFPPMGNERLSWVWAIFPVVPNQPSIQAKLQIQIYYSTYTAVFASLVVVVVVVADATHLCQDGLQI